MCLLGIFHIAPHLGGQKKQFWGVNMHFQTKLANSKNVHYYQNYCIDSNQILHSDKDHQMPFVGRGSAILTKFGTVAQFDPLDRFYR